jgi:tellurite resistance-related uncharacterized protein
VKDDAAATSFSLVADTEGRENLSRLRPTHPLCGTLPRLKSMSHSDYRRTRPSCYGHKLAGRAPSEVAVRSSRYSSLVERAITGFHLDEVGDWVAELSCGHNQHVRHRPPFQVRTWVLEEDTRVDRIGTSLSCPLCSRGELPDNLRFVRSSPEWTDATVPPVLLRTHRAGNGTWGLLRVHEGSLQFNQLTERNHDVGLGRGSVHAIPPDMPHRVTLLGSVRFAIDFLTVDRSDAPSMSAIGESWKRRPPKLSIADEGGEAACWSGLVCASCGAVLDGGPHRLDCRDASDG